MPNSSPPIRIRSILIGVALLAVAIFWSALITSLINDSARAEDPPSAKAPAASADQICRRLEQRYGIDLILTAGQAPKNTWDMDFQYASASDQATLKKFLVVFESEFSKYPPEFVKKTKLKRIVIVKHLKLGKQVRWALPDYVTETLYYDFRMRDVTKFGRRVVHHEYYHMIEQQFQGDAYFKDPAWAAFNEPGFKYGKGGAANREKTLSKLNHPLPGFINRYAMSGLEEDKAEIWALLFVPHNWKIAKPWLADDKILQNKILHTKRFAKSVSKKMDDTYWQELNTVATIPAD